jgi:hypothetical protein
LDLTALSPIPYRVMACAGGAMGGLIVASFQWRLLNARVRDTDRWLTASAVGGAAAGIVAGPDLLFRALVFGNQERILGGTLSLPDAMTAGALELRESGRVREAEAIYALVRAEVARQDPIRDADLAAEDVAALERADAQMAAGRVIPHAVVVQGPAACDEFIRRRDAGELDPETAAAIKAFRLGWEADRRAPTPHG